MMRVASNLLYLPASILLLIASHPAYCNDLTQNQEALSFPKHVRYWPEDPPRRRRDLEDLELHIRNGDKKVGVMKMSPDPGEKFYPEYWQYEKVAQGKSATGGSSENLRRSNDEEEVRMLANTSAVFDFRAPFALHTQKGDPELKIRAAVRRSAAALAALEKREFTCPGDTKNCASIGYPNSCCQASEDCFQIQDTGLGPVGCCPRGRSCSGTISVCNAPNLACPQSLGGGCCIPGFTCQGVGCVVSFVTTVVVTPTLPSTSRTTISSSIGSFTFPGESTTSSQAPTSLTCRSDSNPCPSSLGGGCCHTDRVCASFGLCALPPGSSTSTTTTQNTSQSMTITGGPPVRPTSELSTLTGPILTADCPVYFYACSAVYGGGCCQTGRDCAVTSCPPTTYTTVIDASRTVVVPVGPAATVKAPTGTCAPGWATCAPEVGGNCCPSGYQCGTASCTATGASSTGVQQKQSPNAAGVSREIGSLGLVFGMILSVLALL